MAQSLEENDFEVRLHGGGLEHADYILKQVDDLGSLLARVDLLVLDVHLVGLALPQQPWVYNLWLNVKEAAMKDLLSQVVNFVRLLVLVVANKRLANKAQAVVKRHR